MKGRRLARGLGGAGWILAGLALAASGCGDRPWSATVDGLGPVRIEMTVAEAAAALGGRLVVRTDLDPGCDHLGLKDATSPRYMVVQDRIVRIEVENRGYPTAEGIRVGDDDDRVLAVYAGRVEARPHKYVDGARTLVVTPARGAQRRIVFETDAAGRVTRYRVGRMPEVEWVEGCS